MPLFILFLFIHTAFGGTDPDRFASVHSNKKCGPIPWEAFAAQSYNAGGTASTEAGDSVTGDATKQSGTAEGKYTKDTTMTVAGANYELPMTGDQWVSMYLVYTNCVVKTESHELNPTAMWKDVVNGGILKSVDDVRSFMTSTAALTNPAADEWWEEIKKLIKTNTDANATLTAAAFAQDQLQIDDLYKQTAELRQRVTALETDNVELHQNVDSLQTQMTVLQNTLDDQDKLDKKETEELKSRLDKLDALLKQMATELDTAPPAAAPLTQ